VESKINKRTNLGRMTISEYYEVGGQKERKKGRHLGDREIV
jgi:hypothetical protein